MRRVLLAGLAVLLLAVPAVEAAASGARSPITVTCPAGMTCTVNDVAIGSSTSSDCSTSKVPAPSSAPCRFAAVNLDPTSRLTGGASATTWNLWNLDGSTRQSGGADPLVCPSPPIEQSTEDCDTDVMKVAVSASGNRIAMAARKTTTGGGMIAVFDDTGTRQALIELPDNQVVNDVALDANGLRVAAATTLPTGDPSNSDGRIYLWNAAGGAKVWEYQTGAPATILDLTGNILVAGAGGEHLRFTVPAATAFANSGIQGTINDVDAAAGHSKAWSVAGHSSGFFALYSNERESTTTVSTPEYQKREGGETTAINAVAIRDDATAFAVGHEGGRLRLYSLDPSTMLPGTAVTMLAEKGSLGGIDNLAFSSDGRYLAMRSDANIRLYYTGNGLLEEMWSDTRAGAADTLAIDGRGEHVVAAVGSTVLVYDAIHRIDVAVGTASQVAGSGQTYALVYTNAGNRAEAIEVQVQPPSGLTTASAEPNEFTLLPGATRTVEVTIGIPSTWAPGTLRVPIRASLNGGADGAPTTNLDISVPTTHNLVLEAVGSASKGASNGGPAVFDVIARNDGNVAEEVTLSVTGLQAGWTADISPPTLDLDAGEQQAVTVALQPPVGAAQGVRIDALLRHDGVGGVPLELTATVGAVFGVRVTAPVGTVVQPGVSGPVDLTVRNDGNTRDSFVLKINALPAGWLGGFANGQGEMDVLDLEPGETRTVQMTLRAPEDFSSSVPVQVNVVGTSVGDAAKTSTARVLVTVQAPTSSSSSTTKGGDGGLDIPGPAPVLALAAVALAALGTRRRL